MSPLLSPLTVSLTFAPLKYGYPPPNSPFSNRLPSKERENENDTDGEYSQKDEPLSFSSFH